MSKIQRLATALCPGCDGSPCGNCRDVAASILTDPSPLLAALAEAGVLGIESRPYWGDYAEGVTTGAAT